MAQNIESYLPGVRDNGGISTGEPASFGNTINFQEAIVNASAATTLTVAQSGSTVVFNSTTGLMVTLPAPTVGLTYAFVFAKAPASKSHGIITNSSSVFLAGPMTISQTTGNAGTSATFYADGTTHVAMRMNGTTTGGGSIGTVVTVLCTSSTVWTIMNGYTTGSGALATPFNTV